jgi:hypothetical protein
VALVARKRRMKTGGSARLREQWAAYLARQSIDGTTDVGGVSGEELS